MRSTFVTTVTAAIAIAAVVGMPSSAQSQVVVIIGNGAAQPYYQPPYLYPQPYPPNQVVYGAPTYYPAYGYVAAGSGYYNGYYNGYHKNGHYNGYHKNVYYRPYGYGW